MKTRDKIRLFDVKLARQLLAMDQATMWEFVFENLDLIRSNKKRVSMFVLTDKFPIERVKIVFEGFFNDDANHVRETLIRDLCYHSDQRFISYYARSGYYDDISSVYDGSAADDAPISSLDLLPWDPSSEVGYFAGRFDLLNVKHVDLMIESLRKYQDKYEADEYAEELLMLRRIRKSLSTNSDLKAAFIYSR